MKGVKRRVFFKKEPLLMNDMWYLYILECSDGSYYTGVTRNINERVKRHNSGKGAKYTRGRRPCILRYFEKHCSENLVKKREYEIKRLKRAQKEQLITQNKLPGNNMFQYVEGIQNLSKEIIIKLYDSVGWSKYTDKPDELMKSLTNSTYIITCLNNNNLIGLARSISDDSAIHYLQDILVDPKYQRLGIGRELFNRCLNRFDHVRSHVLLTDDEEKQKLFYEFLGFRNTKFLKKFPLNCFVKMKGISPE
jgi:predicted GIY-YIG superfamily endonuclease